jgi:predicted ATPase/class 3 adenylate cyclase
LGGLPTGSVTFVFTDVEGSTRLLHELGAERYGELLSEHRRAIREAFARHDGHEIDTQGDAFFYAFSRAADALAAADEAQRHLAGGRMRVRVGLHSGHPLLTSDGYVGLDVHRAARIAAAGHGGQVLVSGSTRDLLAGHSEHPGSSDLAGDVDLVDLGEHRLKDLTQRERIFQLGTATFPPLTSLNQSNLPVAATPLVGRERELSDLLALLRDGARAVTVLGPGGTGKTRLALQAAAELVEDFPGGVFWVSLGGLTDPELVIATIGNVLEAQGDLAEHIGKKKLLLLLDNFEQLLEAAPAVAALLGSAPGLKVLVTSRSPLHIEAERAYPLDPLSEQDAVDFFLGRAAAAGRTLEPDATVREICRRLDRLPLALELAAARVKVLDARSLLQRLDRALPLLTSGARDAPQRQRTLRAAIEWSYNLLGPAGKSLLARLGVFAGSFSLDAAEAVASADLDGLAELVDSSLLKPTGDGRFILLETIREYALELLEDTGDAAARRQSHATYFLALAERSETELAKADQARWMALLVADEDNLREAMARSAANADTELVLRFVSALWLFWYRRGSSEPERWYRLALSMPGNVAPALRARALYGAAQIPMMRADWQSTRDLLEECRSLAEATADTLTLMRALSDLGTTYHYMGELEASRRCFDEGLTIARRMGDRGRAAMLVGNAGEAAAEEGDGDRAEPLLTEALAEYGAMNDSLGVASTLDSLGKLALQRGQIDRAAGYFREGLSVARPLGALSVYAIFLAEAGRIAVARRQLPAAARMFGATDSLIQRLDVSLYELPDYEASVGNAREGLGEDAFGTAHAAGAVLELDEALSEAEALLAGSQAS